MKSFCLCLPEYPEEIESAKKHFAESGLEDVEFFWGINAPLAGLSTAHPYELDNPGSGYHIGAKQTGIWLSHWMLWNHLSHMEGERFMIVETDAKFLDGWKEKLAEALKLAPTNFDILHIGHCCLEGHPRTHVGGDLYETKHAQCTHCYIVRRAALLFLLRTLRKCYAPIDIQMQLECFPHLNTYAIIPRIVDQTNTLLAK